MEETSAGQRRPSVLERIAYRARQGPPTRAKSRAGRVLAAALTTLGADPVVRVATSSGHFLLDARSRTEAAMLWNGTYDDDDLDFLRRVTPVDGVFMDVGANVGLIFIPMMNALGPGGRAIAVEPVPVNFHRLSQAVSANSAACSVTLLQRGLGATQGTLTLVKEGPLQSSGNAVPALHDEPGVTVRQTTLDEVVSELALSRLDTVKMDVEGFEVEVLRGATTCLEKCRPVIYGEFNNQLMPQRGVSFLDVWSLVRPLGYRCFAFKSRLHLVPRPDPPADLGNAVLIPDEKVEALRATGVTIEATQA